MYKLIRSRPRKIDCHDAGHGNIVTAEKEKKNINNIATLSTAYYPCRKK